MADNKFPVDRAALIEARKNSMSKQMYGSAVKLFCLECIGHTPGPDNELCQDCMLNRVNTPDKRRKINKTNLRKLLREHCIECLGFTLDICSSPNCMMYPLRMNDKLTKEDWKAHTKKIMGTKHETGA